MQFDNDFFIQAQGIIERTFRAERDTLNAAHGKVDPDFKDDRSVVTQYDKQLELKLKEALASFDAQIGFEGEEYGADGSRQTFWLADPIDGTEAFVRGTPYFRNMVALIDAGVPVFCVVYYPLSDMLYVAARGEGAYRNGVQLHVSTRPLTRARIQLTLPFDDETVWPLLKAVTQSVHSIRSADEFTYVVEGKFDGSLTYRSNAKPWDNAPRALLIQEAGGKLANIGTPDKPYDYTDSNLLATNSVIFDNLMDIIGQTIA